MLKQKLNLIRYKNWNIRVKLMAITVLILLCSVSAVSFISYYKYTNDIEKQLADRTQQTIEQLSLNIKNYIEEINRLSVTPTYNLKIMELLEQPTPSSEFEQLEKRRYIEEFLNYMMIAPRMDILSVYIITDEIYQGGKFSRSIDTSSQYKLFDWYKKSMSVNEPVFVSAQMEQLVSNPRYKVFSIVKRLNSLSNNNKALGVIKVDATYSGIDSICKKVNMGKDGGLFIIDQNNTLIYSNLVGLPFEQINKLVDYGKKTHITTEINNKKYLINSTSISSSEWTIVTLHSLATLRQSSIETRNATLIFAIVCSSLAMVILLIFTRSFLKPLMKIIMLMKEVKKGNLKVEFPENRNDEIGYLGSTFNTMVFQINNMMDENVKLVREVYEAKLLQSEAQMSALASQIRPHFLFNTLNLISLLIRCDKQEVALDNIEKLSNLLRIITHLKKEITLEEEVSILDSYLSIQCSRYNKRLEYSINIDPGLYSYKIPALTLQPIVENSVIHGCENKKDKTIISVYSVIHKDCIELSIDDNAIGMSAEILENLRSKVYNISSEETAEKPDNRKFSGGIGLTNVNKRIKLKYGGQYGITINSETGIGTCVKIILPKLFYLEATDNVQATDC